MYPKDGPHKKSIQIKKKITQDSTKVAAGA